METPTLQFICSVLEQHYGIDIKQRCRRKEIVDKRHIFYLVARHYGFKVEEISGFIRFNHSTVTYGEKRMSDLARIYPQYREAYREAVSAVAIELEVPLFLEND